MYSFREFTPQQLKRASELVDKLPEKYLRGVSVALLQSFFLSASKVYSDYETRSINHEHHHDEYWWRLLLVSEMDWPESLVFWKRACEYTTLSLAANLVRSLVKRCDKIKAESV